MELGCGDGQNASLLDFDRYIGLDISEVALRRARSACADKENFGFHAITGEGVDEALKRLIYEENRGAPPDLALSMDVILHLIEDDVYHRYLKDLASLGAKYLLVYSSNHDGARTATPENTPPHVLHRVYVPDFLRINPSWTVARQFPNPEYGDEWERHAFFVLFKKSA